MTEASYTAWDDKQYVWPPPEGWYQASDEKWWPEGYGPQPPEPEAEPESEPEAFGHDVADITEVTAEPAASNDLVDQISRADFGSDVDVAGEARQTAVMFDDGAGIGTAGEDALGGLGDTASGLGDTASGLGDTASGLGDTASVLGDTASGLGDKVSGFANEAPDIGDLMPDSVDDRLSISDVDGMPTADIGAIGELDGLTERVSDFGELSTPDLGDLPAPGLDELPAPDLGDLPALSLDGLPAPGFGDVDVATVGDEAADAAGGLADLPEPTDVADEIPSIQDLASPDLDLSNLSTNPGLDEDVTQVVPTDIGGQFSDPLPPPPGTGPTFEAPPAGPDGGPASDGSLPEFDPTSVNPPSFDAPSADAPGFEVPNFDAAAVEPPTFEAPQVDAPSFGAPTQGPADVGIAPPGPNPAVGDAPPPGQPPVGQVPQQQFGAPGFGQAAAPAGLQQDILASNKSGGRSKTLLFVLLGVLTLAAIGALLFLLFGRSNGDENSAAVTTGPGSVSQPHPRTTGVVVFYPDGDTDQRWVIEVLDPVSVGAGALGAGSEDGDVFAVTRVRVRNESGSDGASIGDLRFNAVNGAGELIDRQNNQCPATPDDLDYNAAVAVGGEVIGAVCWEVPASDLGGLKLGLESAKVAGRVHISLQ